MPFARLHVEERTPCFGFHQNSLPIFSFDFSLALFFEEPFIRFAHSGVVSSARRSCCMCGATHLRFAWCSTPPTANAYTSWSCFARLPARSGHIILSCGVHFEGVGGLRGCLTATMSLSLLCDK